MTDDGRRRLAWRLRHLLVAARRRTVAALRPVLPASARRGLRRADQALDPVRRATHRVLTRDSRPVPPRLLRDRVGASTIESYFATGERWADLVETGLGTGERKLADCRAVLDFGCGAGKVVRHLSGRGPADLHGCDVHAGSIEWMSGHLPGVRATRTEPMPPLPYADGRFDCVYAWSVFSHIDEPAQEAWLSELRRILAPEGILLASILGEESPAIGEAESRLDRDQLRERGVAFCPYLVRGVAYAEFAGSDVEAYGLSYVTRAHVRERWSKSLDVVEILPLALDGLQDVVVMRRPPAAEPVEVGDESRVVGHG